MGRPSDYGPEIAALICSRLADGNSLRTICKADDMPDARTVYRWLESHEEFRQQYARAREDQADALAEEILEIADDSAADYVETDDGPRLNSEHVQRSRLRVDARKWLASKMAPKKYGDKLELAGDQNNPIRLERIERVIIGGSKN